MLPKQVGTGASILNKTGEVAKTIANKTTGVLSNITRNILGSPHLLFLRCCFVVGITGPSCVVRHSPGPDIAYTAGISEVTLRNRIKDLQDRLNLN